MRQTAALLTISLFAICLVSACSSAKKRATVEAPPPAYQPSPESTPIRVAAPAAPKLTEVQEAVKRVFKDAAVVDTERNPQFLAADFNGDASQDLAVVLRPVKLDKLIATAERLLGGTPTSAPAA